MDNDERQVFESARDIPDDIHDNDSSLLMNIDDILDGSVTMGFSHAGREFQQILEDDLQTEHRYELCLHIILLATNKLFRQTCLDPRTHRDRTERQTQGFATQLEDMIVAYMAWQASLEKGCLDSMPVPPPAEEVEGLYRITVMDVFREFSHCNMFKFATNSE